MAGALNYEYLLGRIYQVGRYGKKNVDADVYRRLEHAYGLLKTELENIENNLPRLSNQSIEKIENDYEIECRKIWLIIREAINIGAKKFNSSFTTNDIEAMEKALVEPKKISKEHIDNVIDLVEKIYVRHKIYPK